ncbi:MAG: hypothetical protein HDS03_03170 [Bacteroides sp.]|nr:hypothetical protein [Bacteroides sp.]MDE7441354.1 hypothetical protein [Muribaculaceae bacterium]
MKNLILSICLSICALFGAVKVSAQTIPASMLPEIVAEMQKLCPQEVEKGMVMNKVYLQNSNSEIVFDFTFNEKIYGVSSSELIKEFKEMTPAQKKQYLGEEFAQIATMLPVPVYANFIFADGKTFKMKLTD